MSDQGWNQKEIDDAIARLNAGIELTANEPAEGFEAFGGVTAERNRGKTLTGVSAGESPARAESSEGFGHSGAERSLTQDNTAALEALERATQRHSQRTPEPIRKTDERLYAESLPTDATFGKGRALTAEEDKVVDAIFAMASLELEGHIITVERDGKTLYRSKKNYKTGTPIPEQPTLGERKTQVVGMSGAIVAENDEWLKPSEPETGKVTPGSRLRSVLGEKAREQEVAEW